MRWIVVSAAGVLPLVGGLHACDWQWNERGVESGFSRLSIDADGPRDPWGKSVGDIDGDGRLDLVVGGNASEELVWYHNPSWTKSIIAEGERFSTDHEVVDVDGDGRNDIVSLTKTRVLWYRNPDWAPTVIDTITLHDVEVADFDSDGDIDVVGRDQSAFSGSGASLHFYRQDAPSRWARFTMPSPEGEGLRVADIDADNHSDVVMNGVWFRNPGELGKAEWAAYTYAADWDWPHAYIDIGDINADGRVDIVLAAAEQAGQRYRLSWFEASRDPQTKWIEHVIDPEVEAVQHFVAIGDMDNDGAQDVVIAEMHQGVDPDEVKLYLNSDRKGDIWDGRVVASTGSHSMRLLDIDGDGDLDLFGANWSGDHQPVEMWLNHACDGRWKRHVVDDDMPWRAIFVAADDLDGDGLKDISAGGWWYRNPGNLTDPWSRNAVVSAARNMAAIYDFDQDGDADILATGGKDAAANADFVWARNDGRGQFEMVGVGSARGDFLQGVAIGKLAPAESLAVALSWHRKDEGVQIFIVPNDPTDGGWPWLRVSTLSQDEALSAGDIDGDGAIDLLLGTRWLRNGGEGWSSHTLHATQASPDRNRLADMNRDGRLDAVVGYQAVSDDGLVAWYEQAPTSTSAWREHVIASVTGPMALDVGDTDGDGDPDVVVGEHNLDDPAAARLLIFENRDGFGREWRQQIVHTGDEHHDGAQLVDIDNDGDNDIVSIGWSHRQVLLYENRAANCPVEVPPLSTLDVAP